MKLSDFLELVALACLSVAAFALFALPGVLICAGAAFAYLSRVYAGTEVKRPGLPKLKLPRFRRGED